MSIKLGSLFDGIGGFPYSGIKFGITPAWASEIEPWPIKVTEKHFPNMKHLGDITQIDGAEIEPVDIVTFGSPCFPAGTLVLTEMGYKPIENIAVGERVLTHTGKWEKVLRTGSKVADTIVLNGFGHYGLETTREHPFYASEKKRREYKRDKNGKQHPETYMTTPSWVEAQNMKNKFWATPVICESLPIPEIKATSGKGKRAPIPDMDLDFWWFVGRWLGDGWLRSTQRPHRKEGLTWGQIFLCCSHPEAEFVKEKLSRIGLTWANFTEQTTDKFRTTNKDLCNWLLDNFGQYADGKRIPLWVLSLSAEYRQAILDGYFSADGWVMKNGTNSATTVSKYLALGMRLIAESLGYSSMLYLAKMKPKTTIEGRTVNQKDCYTVRYSTIKKQTSRKEAHGYSWGKVRDVLPGRKSVQVFNLEVGRDNSYVIENIIVHNCQDLSVAGKREGLAGERSGLFMDAIRIIRQMRTATGGKRPRFAVWENVPGAFSSNKGEDFRAVLEEITEAEIPMPGSGKWATAGMVRTERVDIAWRVLDAQYWGVPQRRRRIFLVADFAGQCASEILFIEEGLSGDFAESGKAREEAAATVGDGVKTAGGNNVTAGSHYYKGPGMRARTERTFVASYWDGGQISDCLDCSMLAKGQMMPEKRRFPAVLEPQLYDMTHADEVMRPVEKGIAPTLNSRMDTGGNQVPVMLAFTQNQREEIRDLRDKAGALAAEPGMKQQTFIYGICSDSSNSMKSSNPHSGIYKADTTRTLDLNGGNPACNQGGMAIVQHYAVRRLTPLECLRLQGFPDYWLDIKGMSDTAKYKAIGNSVAIPCVKFVLGGIARVLGGEKK